MKEFSEFEKKIINRIIELDEKKSLNVLGNILSGIFAEFAEYYIKVESSTNCSVQIEESYFLSILSGAAQIDKIKEIIEGTSKKIFTTVKLLEYLERENLIYLSGDSKLRDIGMKIHDGKYTDSTPFDKEICELLYKFSAKTFLPSESLKVLSKNGFISEEEIRHRELVSQYNKTIKCSAGALCVSLMAVFVSAFLTVKTETRIDPYLQPIHVVIESNELKELNRKIDMIQQTLRSNNENLFPSEQEQFQRFQVISKNLNTELENMKDFIANINKNNKAKPNQSLQLTR